MVKSYIPDNITYIFVDHSEIIKEDTKIFNNSQLVISGKLAIARDSTNFNKIESAKNYLSKYGSVKTLTLKNTEINEIQLIESNNIHNNSYFNVLIHGTYIVKLHHSILLDIIINKQVYHGNFIGSSFIWANINSHMKLVRVGSNLYNDVIKYINYKKKIKVKTKDLIVGEIYENSRNLYLYLGKVNTASIDAIQFYMYNNINEIITYISHRSKPYTTHLWMTLDQNDLEEIYYSGLINYLQNTNIPRLSYLEFCKTKQATKTSYEKIHIDDDTINNIRSMYISLYERAEMLFNTFFYTDFRFIVMSKYPEKIKLESHLRSLWYE